MKEKHVHIIGGGIIGLCSAWYLIKQGIKVTIIDASNMKDGTSWGNAGMIVPSHFIPMSAPGVITQGLKWLLDKKSPFYIRPSFNPQLIKWLWHFISNATPRHVQRSIPILCQFHETSKQLYQELIKEENIQCHFEQKGLLMLFRTDKQATKELMAANQALKYGVEAQVLDNNGLKTLDPTIAKEVLGGVYYPGDAHLSPHLLMDQLKSKLRTEGVELIHSTAVTDFEMDGCSIRALYTDQEDKIPIDEVIFCTGQHTADILSKCGIKLLLQNGKGYSMTFRGLTHQPSVPAILAEAKVAITPMGCEFRIGGTLELGGKQNIVNKSRVEGILSGFHSYYDYMGELEVEENNIWIGHRPCTPDGLPYIGRSKNINNLIIASGHGMLGLSLGPGTGKIVSQIVTNEEHEMDISLFTPERF